MSNELESMKEELNQVCSGMIVRVESTGVVKVSDGMYLNLSVKPAPLMNWKVVGDLPDGSEFEGEYSSTPDVVHFFETEVC